VNRAIHSQVLVDVDGKSYSVNVFEESSGETIFSKAGDRGAVSQRAGSEGHVDQNGKNAVGSWTSVIPCTGAGSPCFHRFDSPEKEHSQGHAQEQPSPGSDDYGRKSLDVSQAEASNTADDRDVFHVPSPGKRLKSAFMEDMRATVEKSELGASFGNTTGMHSLSKALQGGGSSSLGEEGGPISLRIEGELSRRESSGPKEKPDGPVSKTSVDRPTAEGLKKKLKPKNKKKEKMKLTSLAEK
ncbi:hypothetical protein Ancab_015516, partial [Ancistrocladus abbreviatus]